MQHYHFNAFFTTKTKLCAMNNSHEEGLITGEMIDTNCGHNQKCPLKLMRSTSAWSSGISSSTASNSLTRSLTLLAILRNSVELMRDCLTTSTNGGQRALHRTFLPQHIAQRWRSRYEHNPKCQRLVSVRAEVTLTTSHCHFSPAHVAHLNIVAVKCRSCVTQAIFALHTTSFVVLIGVCTELSVRRQKYNVLLLEIITPIAEHIIVGVV